MKKFLSLILVFVMLLSLAACGGGKDDEKQSEPVNTGVTNTDPVESDDVSQPPEKVEGDRVLIGDRPDTPDYVKAGWEPGPVPAEAVLNNARMPIEGYRTKLVLGMNMGDVGNLNMTFIMDNGEINEFEISTLASGIQMSTRSFVVDGQTYLFTSSSAGGESTEALYRIPETSSTDDEMIDPTDMIDASGNSPTKMKPSDFESCECLGEKDGKALFKMVTKADNIPITAYIDLETGWLTGVTYEYKVDNNPIAGVVTTNLEYVTKDSLVMDVTDAVEGDGTEMMNILAQFLSFGIDSAGGEELIPPVDEPDVDQPDTSEDEVQPEVTE